MARREVRASRTVVLTYVPIGNTASDWSQPYRVPAGAFRLTERATKCRYVESLIPIRAAPEASSSRSVAHNAQMFQLLLSFMSGNFASWNRQCRDVQRCGKVRVCFGTAGREAMTAVPRAAVPRNANSRRRCLRMRPCGGKSTSSSAQSTPFSGTSIRAVWKVCQDDSTVHTEALREPHKQVPTSRPSFSPQQVSLSYYQPERTDVTPLTDKPDLVILIPSNLKPILTSISRLSSSP